MAINDKRTKNKNEQISIVRVRGLVREDGFERTATLTASLQPQNKLRQTTAVRWSSQGSGHRESVVRRSRRTASKHTCCSAVDRTLSWRRRSAAEHKPLSTLHQSNL